jgi:hypothetical protein
MVLPDRCGRITLPGVMSRLADGLGGVFSAAAAGAKQLQPPPLVRCRATSALAVLSRGRCTFCVSVARRPAAGAGGLTSARPGSCVELGSTQRPGEGGALMVRRPGWCEEIRTRRAAGRITNRNGGLEHLGRARAAHSGTGRYRKLIRNRGGRHELDDLGRLPVEDLRQEVVGDGMTAHESSPHAATERLRTPEQMFCAVGLSNGYCFDRRS